MSAEAALAAAAASEGDHAGVQSPRSSSLSSPSDPSQQPAAFGQMVQRSREVSLSQSGGCTGSSTSKGATMPGTRACSAKKLDTSTGEMPVATFQVRANSMAARQLFSCSRAFPATIAAASLSCLPAASFLPLCHGSWPQCAAPLRAQSETRTAGQDVMHGIWARTDALQQDKKKVHARHLHLHALPALFLRTLVCTRLHPSPTPAHPGTPFAPSSPSLRTLTRTLNLTVH